MNIYLVNGRYFLGVAQGELELRKGNRVLDISAWSEDAKETVISMVEAFEYMQQEVNSRGVEIESLEKTLKEAEDDLADEKRAKEWIEEDLDKVNEEADRMQEEIDNLQEEVAELRAELDYGASS